MVGCYITMLGLVLVYSNSARCSLLCLGKNHGALIANPISCNHYYYCDNGFASLQKCAAGKVFENIREVCVNHTTRICQAPTKCANVNEAKAAEACNEFQKCNGTYWELKQCKPNKFYDTVSRKCVHHRHARNKCDRCAILDDARLYSYTNGSCNTFLQCSKGKLRYKGVCYDGQFYDESTDSCFTGPQPFVGSCNPSFWKSNLQPVFIQKCGEPGQTRPTGACNRYLRCDGKQWEFKQCTGYNFFDTVSGNCVHPFHARNGCNPCPLITTGFIHDYSNVSCNSYIHCVHGQIRGVGGCPKGQYYGRLSGNCTTGRQPPFGRCNPSYWGTKKEGPKWMPSKNEKCIETDKMMPSKWCNRYFYCNGISWQLKRCSALEIFDTISQECMSRLHARNDCDRCVGSNNKRVNSYSRFNCTGYLKCANGVQKGRGFCPKGKYFNEQVDDCVSGPEPKFGSCNPSYRG